MNLYKNAKNQATSLICSGDTVDGKILQFNWLRTFWTIFQEQKYFQIWNMCRNTASNINFHYRPNSVKTTTAAVDPWHLKVEVANYDFPNCSYVINRTCQYPMLIM